MTKFFFKIIIFIVLRNYLFFLAGSDKLSDNIFPSYLFYKYIET